MTETEYQRLKAKIEREYPARQKLAKLAGRRLGDETLLELYVLACVLNPDKDLEARSVTCGVLTGSEGDSR